ncbi:N-acyl-D-amino-acid deacylase family protein [Ramlibacter tataouinensis]|uniref:Candidate D-aminoacylase (N-acyl-D-amino-acid deacylase) n=1 Tax=Ramlibacter tataouinensis (strain ATCC BAA-407 / DSM 14655 / LMG 21543 / TTB310) TaxID=365046 RepID=F5Y1S5_RAMTT|nr:D-aminoacylase [Ramlibacter tataouinensis]AEG92326.1 candidate D-aminoacylase (N-acyl-D-amino-acid deacylase) [Ramlibacter tataouinensis TTB310]
MHDLFDLLIRNADIVDGTGAPRFPGDIGIRGDRIERIGDLAGRSGRTEIDLGGRVAAPGFIDAHTHDDRLMLSGGDMAPKVSQGVTTVVGGNCGISLAPMPRPIPQPVTPPLNLLDDQGGWFRFPTFASYLQALREQPAATNCAMLVGHTTLRVATMENLERPATPDQVARMRALVQEAMEAGAIGVSTGLFYEPAVAAPTEEVIETCRPLKDFDGLYCTHMRDEGDRVIESLEETFRIGREVGVTVVISHHKVIGSRNYGRSEETLAFIRRNMALQPICLDCYPYTAGSTILSWDRAASSARVIVSWSKGLPRFAGRDLADVARELGVSQEEAVRRLTPAGAIYFRMDEADVQRILQFDDTMIGSDGLPHDASPHPRLWGSFPRVLGHYGRSLGLFPLETAVHKMTGLTAAKFGLADRGVLREGAHADLTLFDAATVDEAGTYARPIAPARGIDTVVVNGSIVWREGRASGARPGRVLARQAAGGGR